MRDIHQGFGAGFTIFSNSLLAKAQQLLKEPAKKMDLTNDIQTALAFVSADTLAGTAGVSRSTIHRWCHNEVKQNNVHNALRAVVHALETGGVEYREWLEEEQRRVEKELRQLDEIGVPHREDNVLPI